MNQALANYRKTMVNTASPLENVIAVQERCLQHLATLARSIEENTPDKQVSLQKAMDIIQALDQELNFSQGDIPLHLHTLYECMLAQLAQANLANDPSPVKLCELWLGDLLATWRAIQRQAQSGTVASPQA
jgi:flagellar biosynthetic protein FliS